MIDKIFNNRLLFFWITSAVLASLLYFALWAIMPSHFVFGALYRMYIYHWKFPLQYIAIPCFFYGIIAILLANKFAKADKSGKVFLTIIIITLTVLISSPFGGMLWHYHDMKAGFFPPNWPFKLVSKGIVQGLRYGWLIVVLSIPYNIIGFIACYFITEKGSKLGST